MAIYQESSLESKVKPRRQKGEPGSFLSQILEKQDDLPDFKISRAEDEVHLTTPTTGYRPHTRGFDITNRYFLANAQNIIAAPGSLDAYLEEYPEEKIVVAGKEFVLGKTILEIVETVDEEGLKRKHLLSIARGDRTKTAIRDSLDYSKIPYD